MGLRSYLRRFFAERRLSAGLEAQLSGPVAEVYEPRIAPAELQAGFAEMRGSVDAEKERLKLVQRSISDIGIRFRKVDGGGFDFASKNLREVRSRVSDSFEFRRILMQYVTDRCGGRASECYGRAGVSRQLYSKIISSKDRCAAKRTVMQLCIGLKLSRAEADVFMASAGYAFSRASFEDMSFAFCLEKKAYSVFDLNELLVLGGCKPIVIS